MDIGQQHHSCPRCKGRVQRIHRHPMDRLLSIFRPVYRYQCFDIDCGWEGTLPAPCAKGGDTGTKTVTRL